MYDAFNKGRREEALRLLKQVKDPCTGMSQRNFTLLHCAAYHGWLDVVQELIKMIISLIQTVKMSLIKQS